MLLDRWRAGGDPLAVRLLRAPAQDKPHHCCLRSDPHVAYAVTDGNGHVGQFGLRPFRPRPKRKYGQLQHGSMECTHLTRNGQTIRTVNTLDDASDVLDRAHQCR